MNKARQSKRKSTCPHKKIPSNTELGDALAIIWELFKYVEKDLKDIQNKLSIDGNASRASKLYNSHRGSSDVKTSSLRETYVSTESESTTSSSELDSSDDDFVPENRKHHGSIKKKIQPPST